MAIYMGHTCACTLSFFYYQISNSPCGIGQTRVVCQCLRCPRADLPMLVTRLSISRRPPAGAHMSRARRACKQRGGEE